MKTFVTAVAFLVTHISLAQSNNIVGNWKMDWTKCYSSMTTFEKERFDNMPDVAKNDAIRSFSSRTFHFMENGSIEVSWDGRSGPRSESGTWQLSGDRLTITINEVPREYTLSYSDQAMILNILTKPETALVSRLILNRK